MCSCCSSSILRDDQLPADGHDIQIRLDHHWCLYARVTISIFSNELLDSAARGLAWVTQHRTRTRIHEFFITLFPFSEEEGKRNKWKKPVFSLIRAIGAIYYTPNSEHTAAGIIIWWRRWRRQRQRHSEQRILSYRILWMLRCSVDGGWRSIGIYIGISFYSLYTLGSVRSSFPRSPSSLQSSAVMMMKKLLFNSTHHRRHRTTQLVGPAGNRITNQDAAAQAFRSIDSYKGLLCSLALLLTSTRTYYHRLFYIKCISD